ncbi:unnamed protein product [Durusdinium trenchii]|uniref:Reverse transcriptase Ty1/copia-type domain-containing protein n=1 Tax=Durusdinium trenchii TaxID=1381693 RepID=A0ABP0RL49_9DINO
MRFVPLPYPSVSTVKQWRLQGKTQEENGIVPKGTFQKAELWQAWTVSNMSDCIWLRNRMGIRYAFLEDPILMGMLAAKSAKGLTARVKKESIAEAVEKAHQSQMQGTADQEARAMIGPRGGLPTLRSDLLRLAALLHVHIGEKDTVPVIKEKLKPMVEALKGRTPAADSRASSSTAQPPPVRPTSAPVQKPAAKPPPRAIQSFTPQPCEVLHQTRSMAALEQLLKQVSAAVEQIKDQPYSMQTQGTMPQQYSLEQASDVSMNDLDAEAQRQLMEDAALSMEAVYEEKLEAQYGEWGMLELTPEQKERAWEKHRRDQLSRFGVETAKINQALQTEFENEMNSFVNDEVFVHAIDFTTCLKPLNSSVNLEEILEKGRILMRFALELAAIQHEAGRHYILENPQPSAAWKEPDMVKFLDEFEAKVANLHQCQFGLRSLRGGLHRKATRVASSSFPVVALLDGRVCDRSHGHDPVIGGRVVTERAGHYPGPLARAFVVGMERQFNSEVAPRASEVLAVSHGEDADEDGESSGIYFPDSETDEEDGTKTPNAKIPASVRAAIARLHDNTGHRSNRRLARALAISGAPAAAIQAAKEHKCSICAERAPPKSQRVGSLPQPRDVSDQVHIDLLEAEDCKGTKYYIIHATDFCTRFQMSELLERKTAGAVVNFLKTRWWPIFGPMRTLVADQGLLVAVEQGSEGNTGANAYISFKGQLTKCSLEHVRRASPMEQIVAGDWEEAIREAVASALRDMTRSGLPARPQEVHDQPIPEESEWPPVPISESESPSTESPDGEPLPAHPAFPTVGETPPVKPRERQPSSDLPPVHPREMVNALQSGTEASVSRLPSHSGVMASRLTTPMTRQNTPMAAPPLFAGASSSSAGVLGAQIERARLLEKRPAEMETEELRSLASSQAAFEQPVGQPGGESELHDTLVVSKEDVMSVLEQGDKVHPLIKLYCEACVDRANPLDAQVHDHGTWDGRWGLPSRSEFLARKKLGLMWPCGADELHEANAVQAARKEYYWRAMTPDQKAAFRVAAEAGWSVWETNEAVEVLDDKTSQRIRADLKAKKEDCKILTPRWVFTDKHDGLRTKENNLGLKANARLVVPGFKDVLSFSLRKDAPTASRLSQHLVFSYVASYFKDHGWRLMSCDVKSAFLKGDPYMDGTRELFIENTKGLHGEPQLPFGASCLARVRKGVFGLSDAPRQWYLRLHRALTELGWERNVMDAACWMLWDAERKTLLGICLSHVDDLLVGGGETARNSILSLEKVLGFGSVEHNSFNYCGKRISQDLTSGVVTVTMKEYHENVRPAVVPLHRRADPNALLTSSEQKQLRALLGSLQWLVAQARIDQGFALSTLQGEQPQTVGTLLRCNLLLKQMKLTASFGLTFRPMCLEDAGVMVITDSSLGNVTKEGSTIGSVEKRVFSQSSYMVLLADKKLMSGEEGQFCLLDGRSHRLSRVCRSTYAAELLGAEEAFDCGQFIRGVLASFRGFPMENRFVESIMDLVPLSVVVDAKDVHDKCNSDSTCGAQKSLAFAVAWMRSVLRRPRTSLRWTATENMIVDGGTKFMDMHHMRTILNRGRWSVKFNVDFIKGKSKGTKGKPAAALSEGNLPGEPLPVSHPVFPYLHQLGDRPGWHFDGDLAINVARDAKSFRSPAPRCDVKKFHLRSTFGRFDHEAGASEWRALEEEVDLNQLANLQQLIGATVTLFGAAVRPLFISGTGAAVSGQEWRVRSLVKSSYLGWNPQGWRAFMREMQWWMSALDLEGTKKYNLAARWLLRQSGIVRQRGEEFSPADLEYQREITATDPVTEEVVVITPEDPLAGLHKLLRALEGINGKTVLDKRGDLRNAFYLELRRRPGERLAEFCTRFRSAVADLKAEGVVLPSSELGWFLKQKLGLDAIRVQLLETALQGKESYEETELEVLRLFRDLHVEEEEPHEETHEDEPDEQYSLEEVLQAEAEILATELEEAVDDGIGPDIIQDVEETVESAAEALLTMREARSKLAEVRKDRGYGKASTGADSPKGKMANKKSKLPCFDCNQLGHWAGDPECKNPGAGLGRKSPKKHPKSVKVVETMNTEHVVADPTLLPAVDGNGALAVSCVSRNLKLSDVFHAPNSKEVHAVHTGLTADKRLAGALDSACNRTVTGSEWLHSFLRCLEHAPQAVRDLVQSSPEHEVFRFGDGGTQVSSTRWRIPVMLGDTVLCVWVSEVPVPSLGLLLGRDFLESVGANMSFANRVIQFEYLKCHALPLKQLAAGHYMLRLLPSHWAVLWLTMLAAKAAHSAGREDNETRQHVRWTRMVARLAARQAWHLWGVFLWLVRRPSMRFVPLPYPSVSTVKQWRLQGKTQEENGIVPKGTFQKAELWQAWTVSNMSDCIWLRNRMGIRYAFLEDPILMGMLAAKSAKGLTARVKKESIAEAVEKAHQSQMQGTADQEARAMIGPRGGLPTLRSDLLRLAALLHVHIGEKDTVPVIKEKLKPMVEALKGRTPAADSRASSSTAQPPPVRPTSAPVQKPAAKPPPRAIQSFTPQPCEVLHQTRSMAALEQLLKQVSAAVEQIKDQPYSMQTQGTMPQQYSLEQASDVSMNDLDAEAQRQLMEDAALSMEAVYEEKLEAQYGEWGMLELTPEQKERVLDP